MTYELGERVEGFEALVALARRGKCEEREWTFVRKDGTNLSLVLAVIAMLETPLAA